MDDLGVPLFQETPIWCDMMSWVVVWNLFFPILGIIIPTDYFFPEGLKPPTSVSGPYNITGICCDGAFCDIMILHVMMIDEHAWAF